MYQKPRERQCSSPGGRSGRGTRVRLRMKSGGLGVGDAAERSSEDECVMEPSSVTRRSSITRGKRCSEGPPRESPPRDGAALRHAPILGAVLRCATSAKSAVRLMQCVTAQLMRERPLGIG